MGTKSIRGIDDLRGYGSWLEVVKTYAKCFRVMSQRLGEVGLSVAQHEVLLSVAREEGLSQRLLAKRLLVAKSNVTGMLQRLEAQGFIYRERDPADARGRRVFLTAEGRAILKRSVRAHAGVVELMTAKVSDREIAQLEQIMASVGRQLEAALRTST